MCESDCKSVNEKLPHSDQVTRGPSSGEMTGLFLVDKASRRCLKLRANRLRNLETCRAIVPSYVGDARPDRNLKHPHSKHHADNGNVTADYQA